MMIHHQAIVFLASIAAANALLLHPSRPLQRRNSIGLVLNALDNDYDGRPSYRRYPRENSGERKNRFNVRNNSNYNTDNNNEDDAYEMARQLASRRGLHLSMDKDHPQNSYADDYRDAPLYGTDYVGVPEQELPRVPMDYNGNKNYNEGYNGALKDLTWGGLKEQNDQNYSGGDRYEGRRSRSMGQRYKNPQPPRQPPREVRPSDFRTRNDMIYQSGPSSQRAQASMGRRANYDTARRMQQPRQPPKSRSSSSSSNSVYPFEVNNNRVNKLSELASTSERIDSAARRMPQYPGPNAQYQYRPSIPYQEPPFRPLSTLSGFSSTAEQMGRSGSVPPSQFMPPPPPPPPPYVQMPQYQQQRQRQVSNNFRAPSIPLSQLALQPNIQPIDQPSQQSQSYSGQFGQQQSQQMPGAFNDRRPQPQQPPSYGGERSQSESFGGNPSASFSPLPFQQLSQADFTRPFQGGSQQSQQQQSTTSSPNNSNPGGGARQQAPDFNGAPHPFDQRGPPPFGQEPPPPPFGPDVHIFQNPFMNDPMFQQEPRTPTQQQPKSKDDSVKVPKDPNVEKRRRQAVSNSSNNPGSGIKIPKDPLVERRRNQEQQQSTSRSNDGTKVPRDPFLERQRLQQRQPDTNARNQEVKVPREPMRNQQTERRPKEPRPKSSSSTNMRIPREPSTSARRDNVPREPPQRGRNVDNRGDDMSYEDFASFFDMPKL